MISIFSLSLIYVLHNKDNLSNVEPIVAYPFTFVKQFLFFLYFLNDKL